VFVFVFVSVSVSAAVSLSNLSSSGTPRQLFVFSSEALAANISRIDCSKLENQISTLICHKS